MGLLHGMSDEVPLQILRTYHVDVVHDSFRLLYALSLLSAGLILDRFQGYGMLLATLASLLLLLNIKLLDSPGLYFWVLATDCLATGFIIVFAMHLFARNAPFTTRPVLWAGGGRILEFSTGSARTLLCHALLGAGYVNGVYLLFLGLSGFLISLLYLKSANYQIEKSYRAVSQRLRREQETIEKRGQEYADACIAKLPGNFTVLD